MWWLRIRDLLERDRSARETRGGVRTQPKTAGAIEGAPRDWTRFLVAGTGAALLILHLVLFPPIPRLTFDFPQSGEIADQSIRAPFTFAAPLLDRDVEIRRLEKVVVEPPVLRKLGAGDVQFSDTRMELWLEGVRDQLADTSATMSDRVGILGLQFPALDPDDLYRLFRSAETDSLVPRMERAWRQVMRGGVVDVLPAGKYDRVVILTDQAESLQDLDLVVAQAALQERLQLHLSKTGLEPVEYVQAAAIMRNFITPNLVYEAEETRRRQAVARQSIPTTREFFKGERIVDQGVRVTEEQDLFLEELRALVLERGGGDDGPGRLARLVARALLVSLALGVFGWLGWIHFQRKLAKSRSLIALAVIFAMFLGGSSFALDHPGFGPMAVPIVLLSLLATVLFSGRVGYTATLLAVTLLALLPDVSGTDVFAWFMLGMVTVVSVRRIQKRSQFYQTILLLTVMSVLLIFVMGVGVRNEDGGRGAIYLVGLFSPVLSVAFGLFLLPVVEPLVGVCSDLTLLELSDLNHPLLQRMALEAQGTYHHSQVVGQLAEHAARAIDANALLTRVGALFHDIGKMLKPEYYVENQRPDVNKHDELSPSMSALVIAAHVKEGMEMARKWRLPQTIIDFIPEHHGTLVMEYFYHKALEGEGNETVKVDDFRYPGPKPHSRETAILMLADAVEAATRSLAKPTPSRIKEMTKQIIDKRMLSGELDESGLTLSDLARIRESFVPLLTGIHHSRIVYPGQRDRDTERVPERRGERKVRP